MKTRRMLALGLIGAVLSTGVARLAQADIYPTTPANISTPSFPSMGTDLFLNATVNGPETSALYNGFSANAMFDGIFDGNPTNPTPPVGDTSYTNTIFADSASSPADVVFNDSPSAQAISSYRVVLADDSAGPNGPQPSDSNRGISDFQLWSLADSGNTLLANVTLTPPNYYTSDGSSVIAISGSISPPAGAHLFEAFFFSADADWGPRVEELQGFANSINPAISTSAVPLPAAGLGGTALLVMIGVARMSRRRLLSPT
jgi:hypothetical protein